MFGSKPKLYLNRRSLWFCVLQQDNVFQVLRNCSGRLKLPGVLCSVAGPAAAEKTSPFDIPTYCSGLDTDSWLVLDTYSRHRPLRGR